MTTLENVRELLPAMLPTEKAQAIRWLARDIGGTYQGIESTPAVLGANHVLYARAFRCGSWCKQENWGAAKLIC